MNRILLLSFIISINPNLAFLINNKEIYYDRKQIRNYIYNENLSIPIEYNQNFFNKRENFDTCKSKRDCGYNHICYMNKCYKNITNQICIEDPKDKIRHRGNCTDPFYCEDGICKKRISYNDECNDKLEYQCYETKDKKEPKCRRNKCQIKSEEEINFITSSKGMYCVIGFGVFLIGVFFTVLHFTNRYNKKHSTIILSQSKSNSLKENSYPNELNPSFERNLYMRSIKEKEMKESKDNSSDKKSTNTILNKYKTNEPYTTVNSKKDFDPAGNTYPKTPQTASTTLINKSYSSTNNLIERNRTSQRSSILNSYRRNSSLGGLSPNENSLYNISFQDFNTSNSFSYISPSDSKNMFPQYNTFNSTTIPLTPITPASPSSILHKSASLFNSGKKISPILTFNNKYTTNEAIASTSTPYIMDVEDDDNHTTLSFDDGVIKMSNKNSSMSFSNKDNNKDIVEISYSEDVSYSEDIIIPYPQFDDKKKDIAVADMR